jgi:hypothetical protein
MSKVKIHAGNLEWHIESIHDQNKLLFPMQSLPLKNRSESQFGGAYQTSS